MMQVRQVGDHRGVTDASRHLPQRGAASAPLFDSVATLLQPGIADIMPTRVSTAVQHGRVSENSKVVRKCGLRSTIAHP